MNGYLLDTDILISFLRGKNEKLKKNIHAILEKQFYIGFSVISLGELYLGVFKSQNPPKNLSLVNKLKETLDVIGLDDNISLLYGEIQAVLEKAGQVIGDFDVLIASSAISKDLILVTGNEKHYKRVNELFGQLSFEKWEIK
jgi:predicted nucleic acid-binding protein